MKPDYSEGPRVISTRKRHVGCAATNCSADRDSSNDRNHAAHVAGAWSVSGCNELDVEVCGASKGRKVLWIGGDDPVAIVCQ
jgi:hypothetical protein